MKQRRNVLFIIAIDKYHSPIYSNLENAVFDAKQLEDVLTKKYSFELHPESLYDYGATKQNIYNSFNNLLITIEPEDNLIVFFAGHGQIHPLTKKGYWAPADSTASVDTLIENSVIKDYLESIQAKHIWLISDSCFSGTFLTRTRGQLTEIPYYKLDALDSRWALTSGGEEKVSDGQKSLGSPFARYLLRYLNENTNIYTCISEVVKYVTILTANNSRQHPHGAFIENIGHEEGEMVLILKDEFVVLKTERTNGIPNTPVLRKELRSTQRDKDKLAAGKEILLVKSFVPELDFLILENFRFDDAGQKKLMFENDKVILNKGDHLELVQRFATWNGLNRYFENREEEFKGSKIVTVKASPEIDNADDSERALEQSDYIKELLSLNKDAMICLHCGERITSNDSFLVEIDEKYLNDNAGNVHKDCLRKADRIIGMMHYTNLEGQTHLLNFDYKRWIELLEKGQGQLAAISNKLKSQKIAVISWNSNDVLNTGNFCIRMQFDDGSSSIMRLGKNIHRFSSTEIDEMVEKFNGDLIKKKAEGDPICKIDETGVFGNYKQLSKLKGKGQTLVNVKMFEKAQYSNQLNENTGKIENDYAPLGLLIHSETKEFVKIDNYIPLISKPEEFESYHANWKKAIPFLEKCTLRIIATDVEMDVYLREFFVNGNYPVIDPIFEIKPLKLISGLIIKDFDELVYEATNKAGALRSGDKVKIVFPDVKTEKFATGTMLTDPFIDEKGEECFIFQPYEEGRPLEELQYKMPLRLAHKIE